MSYSYDFSIVLFAKKENDLKVSYKSIQELHYAQGKVQLIPVLLSEKLEESSSVSEIKKHGHAEIVRAYGEEDISGILSESVKGKYVTFLKAGIRYDEKALQHISKMANGKGADVVFGSIKNKEKIDNMLHEHNVYCDRNHGKVSLEKDIRILHNMYFTYFMKADLIRWNSEIVPEGWTIGVLELVYDTVFRAQSIACTKKICVYTATGSQAIAEWNTLLKSDAGREKICRTLLDYLVQLVLKEGVQCRNNAEYALVYYCYQLAGLQELAGTEVDTKTAETVEQVLSQLTNENAIIQNRYVKQMYKHYILKKFFPKVKCTDSEEIRFVLAPECKEVKVYFMEQKDDVLHMEFTVPMPEEEVYDICLDTGKEKVACPMVFEFQPVMWGQKKIGAYRMYIVDIPMESVGKLIRWNIRVGEDSRVMEKFFFDKYTPLSHVVDIYYVNAKKAFWLSRSKNAIHIQKDHILLRACLAIRRTFSFVLTGKPGIKAVFARMVYHSRAAKQEKKIWLVSDRTNRGDDNGEVVFRYLCEHPVKDVEPYFVIEKNTPDWKELSKIGKLVEPFSKEHKILFLMNELSLSSQANKAVINPFGKLEYYYRDLMFDKKLVFLQHGITKDNQSVWLNKYNRNLFGTIVTTKPEYDSMLEYKYYYTPERIWLTGMPRYDRLYHDEKRYITIMPTWRKNLSPGTDENGVWLISDDFNRSGYFKFYNTLLNDETLLEAAEKYGYTICFMPHPNTISALHMFDKHEKVQFFDMKKSYRDVFAQTDLMVTDYSSVAFDFAYLRKPIVYAQFDRESFFSGSHSYTEGYFNYETDGFGEVEYTLEAVRERLVEYMADGCRLKPEYEKRINATFAFNDKDCCLRLCQEIEKYL